MFGWVKEKAKAKITETRRKEARDYVEALAQMEDDELASLVVIATHTRHTLLKHNNWDLLYPKSVIEASPTAIFAISKLVKDFQNDKQFICASGAMVWVHTLRCVEEDALWYLGRAIWRHLSRGFPYVPEFVRAQELIGAFPNVEGYNLVPHGLWSDQCTP